MKSWELVIGLTPGEEDVTGFCALPLTGIRDGVVLG